MTDRFAREEIAKKMQALVQRLPELTDQSAEVELRVFTEFVEEQTIDAVLRLIYVIQGKWERSDVDTLKSASIAADILAKAIKGKSEPRALMELVAAYDKAPLRWEDDGLEA